MTGNLYLIPTTLGDVAPLEVLPISVKILVEEIDIYIVESEKSARRFIKTICPSKSQSSLKLFTLNKFTDSLDLPTYIEPCMAGIPVGLLSDAGCPAIADPGAKIIRLAHEKKIKIVPVVGPSSILLAMMSSGMNGQNFAFNGYLPIDKIERKSKIKFLEKRSKNEKQAQIFIETPYRNDSVLKDLCQFLKSTTKVCIGSDLSLPTETIIMKTVNDWKKIKTSINKRPTIFIIEAI
jgi:16S rRNA (cytidine1402-2'-O)-methyltransferase